MLLKILKNMTSVFNGTYFEKYDFRFLTVVISLVEEDEVAMAPAFRPMCFLNFELLLFIVEKLTAPYFQVFNEIIFKF